MLKNSLIACSFLAATISFATTSAPFASGVSGDLKWEVRFNLPSCKHEGGKENAWCLYTDQKKNSKKSGIADKLKNWAFDDEVKSLHLAYFSFSNKTVRFTLCDASEMGKNVNIYLDQSNSDSLDMWFDEECKDRSNINVYGLGAPFNSENGHLQHAKVFLASTTTGLKTYKEMNTVQRKAARGRNLRFTSSSANMSSNGLALHFENWMFLETKENKNLAQKNICLFKSFEKVSNSVVQDARSYFSESFQECVGDISAKKRSDLDFYVVPAAKGMPLPFDGMKKLVFDTKAYLRVAIHRLTTASVYKWLISGASKRGVDVKLIFDDDTLRTGVQDGGNAHDVGESDIKAYRYLRDNTKAEISFMETNAVTIPALGGVPHLFHNKFMISDGKALFQGAGNFTGRALNTYGPGNYEQFYIIRIPEVVKAYEDGWNVLRSRSTLRADHPVGHHADIEM
ncbi:phospholipase D-like domain-containing protein [Bacteriovoracaceae bacterium]|nr:phospholipase D-like domain-containing protein [Bacteriovoracaceae bacterium]